MATRCGVCAICLTLLMGCSLTARRQAERQVDPVLPMTMTSHELIHHLNRQTDGLRAWRSIDTTLTVSMAAGMTHRLSGNIACQAPDCFRLTASSVLAHADLGSNSDRCWFYVQPGDNHVLTWQHRDAPLVQDLNLGIPRMDPEWLLAVLGVMPLNPADFELSTGPAGSTELWLTSISDDFRGRSLRRVIKVDTLTGLAREHVIYDHERNPLIRARLGDHRSIQGNILPQTVRLEFPALKQELALRFNKIETDCSLSESLWALPEKRNIPVMDLGDLVRAQAPHLAEPRLFPDRSVIPVADRRENSFREIARGDSIPAPDWDTPLDVPNQRISPATAARYPEQQRSRFGWWPQR